MRGFNLVVLLKKAKWLFLSYIEVFLEHLGWYKNCLEAQIKPRNQAKIVQSLIHTVSIMIYDFSIEMYFSLLWEDQENFLWNLNLKKWRISLKSVSPRCRVFLIWNVNEKLSFCLELNLITYYFCWMWIQNKTQITGDN